MNIEKELEGIKKEAERLARKTEQDRKFTEKNIEGMNSSLDAFYFIIYGSLLGLAINLIANIIHDYFSKFSDFYFLAVILLLCISLILLMNFVIKKWNEIQKRDKLIKEILEGKDDPNNYVKSMKELQNRLKLVKEEYSKISQTNEPQKT